MATLNKTRLTVPQRVSGEWNQMCIIVEVTKDPQLDAGMR